MSHSTYQAIISSPIGKLGITTNQNFLTGIEFLSPQKKLLAAQNKMAKLVVKQLKEYFCDTNYQFDIPLQLQVSDFQTKVLHALQQIPIGETRTYGDLAKQLKTGPRAIGMGCRHNPIPLIIPCHRIVAKHSIGGFGGCTSGRRIDIKTWLLAHERK